MQLPIHIIAGIIIQSVISDLGIKPNLISIILIAICAFSSHYILDPLAKSTYHPPDRIYDNFWLYWHIFTYGYGFLLIFIFFQDYWLGMIFANLIDIWDWQILRRIANKKKQLDWGKKYYLHPLSNKIRTKFLYFMPDFSYDRKGIIPELIVIIFWSFFLLFGILKL